MTITVHFLKPRFMWSFWQQHNSKLWNKSVPLSQVTSKLPDPSVVHLYW